MSGTVYFISEQAVVNRAMSDPTSKAQLNIERQIYDCLGLHPCITALLRSQQNMVILERLQHTLRHRLHELRGRDERPASANKARWALQIAEGLQYIHSRGVKQVDIGTYNVLLDWQDNAKTLRLCWLISRRVRTHGRSQCARHTSKAICFEPFGPF